MCMGGKSKPAPTPAPAPPPPADAPAAPIINETAQGDKNTLTSNRSGRGSLRIDLAQAAPTGGAGLNVPTA
jgi:hypothetical protein